MTDEVTPQQVRAGADACPRQLDSYSKRFVEVLLRLPLRVVQKILLVILTHGRDETLDIERRHRLTSNGLAISHRYCSFRCHATSRGKGRRDEEEEGLRQAVHRQRFCAEGGGAAREEEEEDAGLFRTRRLQG